MIGKEKPVKVIQAFLSSLYLSEMVVKEHEKNNPGR